MKTARWQRLDDGSWGLRITGAPQPQEGEPVEVWKASGEITTEIVGEIIWTSGALTVARYRPRPRFRFRFYADDEFRSDDE